MRESSGRGSRIMEVNEALDGGEGVLVFWPCRLDTDAESSAQHQDLISGFCWSIKQSISVPEPDRCSF